MLSTSMGGNFADGILIIRWHIYLLTTWKIVSTYFISLGPTHRYASYRLLLLTPSGRVLDTSPSESKPDVRVLETKVDWAHY
jgi:hypothetical protein